MKEKKGSQDKVHRNSLRMLKQGSSEEGITSEQQNDTEGQDRDKQQYVPNDIND